MRLLFVRGQAAGATKGSNRRRMKAPSDGAPTAALARALTSTAPSLAGEARAGERGKWPWRARGWRSARLFF